MQPMDFEPRTRRDERFAELNRFSGGDDFVGRRAGFSGWMDSWQEGWVSHAAAHIERQEVAEAQRVRPSFEVSCVKLATLDEASPSGFFLSTKCDVWAVLRGREQGKVAAHDASGFGADLLHRIDRCLPCRETVGRGHG